MKRNPALKNKDREQIFKLFLQNHRLKFSEIEKLLNIRSNMVAYHLESMQKENIIEKNNEQYVLTHDAEKYIPLFSNIANEELTAIPVVLTALISKDNKILLINRNIRPYQNYWSLIGGKIKHEESYKETTTRLIKTKSGLDTVFKSTNALMQEQVKNANDKTKHNFILIFTVAKTNKNSDELKLKESEYGKLKWFDLNEIQTKEKIIPSDLFLIQNKLKSRIKVQKIRMDDKDGILKNIRIEP